MKKYEPRRCEICGNEYIPKRSDQRCCLAPECKKARERLTWAEYREKNYARVLENNRRGMKRRRDEKRRKEVEARDTLIAIGYADRQMAKTLEMAGKVRTEL